MWLNIARAMKVIAFVGFFLPWMVVSCAGETIASATGTDLMLGRLQAAGDAVAQQDRDPVWWVIVMAVLIAVALIGGMLTSRRIAGLLTVVASAASLGLGVWGMNDMTHQLDNRLAEMGEADPQAAAVRSQVADAIRIEAKSGYWITLFGLFGAGAAGLMAVARGGGRRSQTLER